MFEQQEQRAIIREDLIKYYYEHLIGTHFDHTFCSALHHVLVNGIETGSLPPGYLINLAGGQLQLQEIVSEAETRRYGRPLTFKERARQQRGLDPIE